MNMPDAPIEPAAEDEAGKPRSGRLGVTLIVVSGVLWLALFAIPFLQLTLGQKTTLGAGVFLVVQITWWTGVTLVGPTAMQNLKRWFRGKKGT